MGLNPIFGPWRACAKGASLVELPGTMRIPGPYSDDTWDWMSRSQDVVDTNARIRTANGISRVVWELGLVMFVPLMGAGAVGLILKAFGIH